MKSKIYVVLVLIVCLFASSIFVKAEEKKPELIFVREFTVRPSMVAQFVEVTKIWATTCKEHNFSRSWYAWHDGDFHYCYFVPVKDHGDIDSFFTDFNSTMENLGEEELQETGKKLSAAIDSFYDYFIWSMPKYSYVPEEPRLKDGEGDYAIWDMFYITPGKQNDFLGLLEEWQSLLKNKNIGEAAYWYSGGIGAEKPLIFIVLYGNDAADFWTHNPKMHEALGEESRKVINKSMQFVKRSEFRQFWYLKNLSYEPEKK